ncbi:MAG: bacillithiol biosynthesis deacetylase BshB1 [Acidobacteriota bacterium]
MELDLLAFGPHPDDVELFCSGTLIKLALKGHTTGITCLTRGELGTRGSPDIRSHEFDDAAEILGLSFHQILDMPDGNITPDRESKLEILRVIRACRPKIILAPYWEDRHPDHYHASRLIQEAAFLAGLKQIDTGQEAYRPRTVIFYPCWFEFEPSFVVDVTECHQRKMEAIRSYRSQFHHPEKERFGEEETLISQPEFLENIVIRAQRYGSSIGVPYGEAFLVREPLRVDDPVEFFGPECANALPLGVRR